MKKMLTGLSIIAAVSSIISACIGVFYTNGGTTRVVENIYGQQVTLYGDGIYANNSILKVGATKGTDNRYDCCRANNTYHSTEI